MTAGMEDALHTDYLEYAGAGIHQLEQEQDKSFVQIYEI